MSPLYLVANAIEIYSYLILGVVLISWLPIDRENPLVSFLVKVTEPGLGPVRALVNPQALGGIDISPIIVLVGLQFIANALRNAA